MFPLMMPMLIGAGAGLLMNKKDPLKGALMGAALGAGGGALMGPAAGGLLGAEAAGTAAGGLSSGGLGAGVGLQMPAGASSMLNSSMMSGGLMNAAPSSMASAGGLKATEGMASALSYAPSTGIAAQLGSGIKQAKPFMDAASTGMSVAKQFEEPPQQPIQHAPIAPPTSNGQMNALMQVIGNNQASQVEQEAKRRARRQSLLG